MGAPNVALVGVVGLAGVLRLPGAPRLFAPENKSARLVGLVNLPPSEPDVAKQ